MQTLRCIAIDDEPLALEQISAYVQRTPFLELTATFPSAIEAMEFLAEQEVGLLLVDINMPDLNGLDFVRSLSHPPLVIFSTAYSEYAVEGFKVDAVDYLLKPVGYPDFLRAVEKAYRHHKLLAERADVPSESNQLFIKSEYKMLRIETDAIVYIESRGEYLRIYLNDAKPIVTLGSLKSLEERLPEAKFMRIHRSYMVNLQEITAIERGILILGQQVRLPIGEQYKEDFQRYLSRHSIHKK